MNIEMRRLNYVFLTFNHRYGLSNKFLAVSSISRPCLRFASSVNKIFYAFACWDDLTSHKRVFIFVLFWDLSSCLFRNRSLESSLYRSWLERSLYSIRRNPSYLLDLRIRATVLWSFDYFDDIFVRSKQSTNVFIFVYLWTLSFLSIDWDVLRDIRKINIGTSASV